jgi:Mg/Co/Ni transporter MgtE
MFTYERHLVVALVIAVVILAAAVVAALLGVPVPFLLNS